MTETKKLSRWDDGSCFGCNAPLMQRKGPYPFPESAAVALPIMCPDCTESVLEYLCTLLDPTYDPDAMHDWEPQDLEIAAAYGKTDRDYARPFAEPILRRLYCWPPHGRRLEFCRDRVGRLTTQWNYYAEGEW